MHRPLRLSVALVFTLLFAACGDSDESDTLPTTSAVVTSTSAPSSTTTGTPTSSMPPSSAPSSTAVTTTRATCSAAGLSTTVAAQDGLPAPVATMRADLARAAATCDWTALAALVDRNGAGVRHSFGAPGDPIAYWQGADAGGTPPPPMRALRVLLDLPYATQPLEAGAVQYVWPAAHVAVPPSQAQLQQIAATGLYPLTMLEEWVRQGNNYLGYRLAITATGNWTFFVAGD
jgi:hypothetical protein